MPCYQQRTTTLEIDAANLDVLAKALEALGLNAKVEETTRTIRVTTATGQSGYFANGRLVINGTTRLDENAVRREYSKQSILSVAKRQGWQIRFQPNGDIEATRRRFA
jgi:hypothetical protein